MAPYISSHLCDRVWMATAPVAHLDILQNLVANTRKEQSAMLVALPSSSGRGVSTWWIATS